MNRLGLKDALGYIYAFAKWIAVGIAIGLVCGVVGALFARGVDWATRTRLANGYLIWLMPLGGVAIVGLYRMAKIPISTGTDRIISSVRTQEKVPLLVAPLIFISTVITHLVGGSAGREGAALQLGGSIGACLGDRAHRRLDNRRICEMCGMAAVFSALFGTPLTAAIFVLEVIEVGAVYYRALIPCAAASIAASMTATKLGVKPEIFPLAEELAHISPSSALRAAALAALCALVAVGFCQAMHHTPGLLKRLIPNDFARIAAAGIAIAALTTLIGSQDYNGSGMSVIECALDGHARPWDFALKILFTALTLGAGYKGGEIVPSFFVGSTFGCVMGAVLGFDPSLGAALGLISVFCGVTNTPLSSLILSVEMFGSDYLILFGTSVAVAYMLSGHISLYHAQRFARRKLGSDYYSKDSQFIPDP